ncbi:hypothetical protein TL16_g04172 [Triparma laevis f. inornata]|uniref:Uncharacterized protein n=1 Tax=Triparma laevis f. inornata TaxID=1714386 RepID=A0A9W7A9E4_9STRA|nr:hypothetical protein TL16_g04172 [Triparma laevis f. inornata]
MWEAPNVTPYSGNTPPLGPTTSDPKQSTNQPLGKVGQSLLMSVLTGRNPDHDKGYSSYSSSPPTNTSSPPSTPPTSNPPTPPTPPPPPSTPPPPVVLCPTLALRLYRTHRLYLLMILH